MAVTRSEVLVGNKVGNKVENVNKNVSPAPEISKEETKAQKRRKAKRAALVRLIAFVEKNTKDRQLIEDCTLLTPGQRGPSLKSTPMATIIEAFKNKPEWTEDRIWGEFKLGRMEMRKLRNNLIKKAKTPEDRVWIDFNPVLGKYTLAGTGAKMPSGWAGYKPVSVEDLLK